MNANLLLDEPELEHDVVHYLGQDGPDDDDDDDFGDDDSDDDDYDDDDFDEEDEE